MTDASKVFKPSREHVVAIILMTGIALMGILWAPKYLAWLLIFPAVALVWILNTSTTVSENGISVKYLFKKNRTLPWSDLEGVAFKGVAARAVTKGGTEHMLPGVEFKHLPQLEEASRGRITDAITSAQQAADGKYEVIDRDGYKVLMDREEYEAYLAEHPDLPGPRPEGVDKQKPPVKE